MSTANRPTIFPALALLLAAAVLLLYTISYLLGGSPLGKPDAATYTGVPIEEDVSPLTVVVIDAGHGGEDGGASSAAGLVEKEVNLAVAEALRDLCETAGLPVVMTSVRADLAPAVEGKMPNTFPLALQKNKFL